MGVDFMAAALVSSVSQKADNILLAGIWGSAHGKKGTTSHVKAEK